MKVSNTIYISEKKKDASESHKRMKNSSNKYKYIVNSTHTSKIKHTHTKS